MYTCWLHMCVLTGYFNRLDPTLTVLVFSFLPTDARLSVVTATSKAWRANEIRRAAALWRSVTFDFRSADDWISRREKLLSSSGAA